MPPTAGFTLRGFKVAGADTNLPAVLQAQITCASASCCDEVLVSYRLALKALRCQGLSRHQHAYRLLVSVRYRHLPAGRAGQGGRGARARAHR